MKRVRVAEPGQVREGELLAVKAEGIAILLTRVNGAVHAIENKCPHLGLSMARGSLMDGVLRCPWHGSRFDVCTGRNVDWVNAVVGIPMPRWTHRLIALGREPAPVKTLAVEHDEQHVFVIIAE